MLLKVICSMAAHIAPQEFTSDHDFSVYVCVYVCVCVCVRALNVGHIQTRGCT